MTTEDLKPEWNSECDNCPPRTVKRSSELDFLFQDDMIEIKVTDGILTIPNDEYGSILGRHFQQMFDDGLIPDNCECGVFYLVEVWNVIGNFDVKILSEDDNDIDYFIDIIG